MRQFFIVTSVLVLLICFLAPAVLAQEDQQPAAADSVSETEAGNTSSGPADDTSTTSTPVAINFDKYVEPAYPNLARLYWALGLLDVNNNVMIDNFLAITECDMYQSYFTNDLEWREIRESTKEYLRKNYRSFPVSFGIIIPLYLGRYDTDDEYFEVDQKASAIENVRNIETVYYTKPVTCGIPGEIEGYPSNLILFLNRPFSLPRLPVEQELARLFLEESYEKTKKRNNQSASRISKNPENRMAYLELLIQVHSYKETINTAGGKPKAIVFAQIEYIRVFADYEREKLLYQKDMFEDENRRRRKKRKDGEVEDILLPEVPLFEYIKDQDKNKQKQKE